MSFKDIGPFKSVLVHTLHTLVIHLRQHLLHKQIQADPSARWNHISTEYQGNHHIVHTEPPLFAFYVGDREMLFRTLITW